MPVLVIGGPEGERDRGMSDDDDMPERANGGGRKEQAARVLAKVLGLPPGAERKLTNALEAFVHASYMEYESEMENSDEGNPKRRMENDYGKG